MVEQEQQPTTWDRRCAYSQCARPLEYDGRGRPPEYCPDRRWAGGKTCKQMAAAQRAAERAAGLEQPLESFRSAGERLASVVSPLAARLTEVAEAIDQVQAQALSRLGEAEQTSQSAVEQAHAAEEAAETARAAQATAEQERDRARAEADEAIGKAQAAGQRAEQQIAEAWQRVAAADHARGQAESVAHAADARAAAESDQRTRADQRADVAESELRTTREQGEAATRQLAALRDELTTARQREQEALHRAALAEDDAGRLRTGGEQLSAELDQVRAAHADLQAQLATVTGERDRDRATATAEQTRLATEVARLQDALAGQREAARDQAARAERAEERLGQLIAALPGTVAASGTAAADGHES